MKTPILMMAATAIALPLAAAPASAQGYNETRERIECNRELRNADSRGEYYRERQECAREIAQARNQDWRTYRRYDWNRAQAGKAGYYADDYYRDGRYYRMRRLSTRDRIYVGNDGRYYCRRSDGTTGLIVGAAVGGLIGNSLDRGRSSLLGTLIGAGAGAALGREIARGNVRCR